MMRSNYNNFGNLDQFVKSTLVQAEQAIRSSRMSAVQQSDKNAQMYRVGLGRNTAATDKTPQPDPEVYREGPDRPVPGQASAGEGTPVSSVARKQASVDYSKLLKLNFNEEDLLSGIVMAEVLGKPKCLRRGRW